MTTPITPCFWFDGTAKEAAELYIHALGNGSITNDNGLAVNFKLFDQSFIGINGGPEFKMNPSISLFVVFGNEEDLQNAWDKLIVGGNPLMPCGPYPWAKKYGWLQDRFGLSWQLSYREEGEFLQKITPMLMFTGEQSGQTQNAIDHYTKIFPNSGVKLAEHYQEGDGDKTDFIKHAQFKLDDQYFMAMDSSIAHAFGFNEGISLMINCDGQKEVDYFWDKLTEGGMESQCGWLKDKFGVSWQVTPKQLFEHLSNPDREKAAASMQAMLKMKKIVINEL